MHLGLAKYCINEIKKKTFISHVYLNRHIRNPFSTPILNKTVVIELKTRLPYSPALTQTIFYPPSTDCQRFIGSLIQYPHSETFISITENNILKYFNKIIGPIKFNLNKRESVFMFSHIANSFMHCTVVYFH